jgi:DNA repair protein RadA/Sms
MTRICKLCSAKLPENKTKCKECGTWNIEDTFQQFESKSGEDADGSITLDKVKSEEAKRLITGPWDYCWGGGIVQTSTTLIGGSPGAGKTTLLLQICDIIGETIPLDAYEKGEGQCLYIAAEQSSAEIKLTAERLDLDNIKMIRMVPAMGGYAEIGNILARRKPKFAVLDSLQGLCGEDQEATIAVLDIMKKFAVEGKFPFIAINQVTKDGELAGLMKYQHHVDCTMTFFPEPDGTRILEVMKNRFGRAHIDMAFEMTEKGLVHLPDYDNEDTEDEAE